MKKPVSSCFPISGSLLVFSPRVITFILFPMLSILIFIQTSYAQACKNPNILRWYHYSQPFPYILSQTVAADSDGNIYVGAHNFISVTNPNRVLQKYTRRGDIILGEEGSPWYKDDGLFSGTGWTGMPWQKIEIDNQNNKLYIFFLTHGNNTNAFWLACHELANGKICDDWAWIDNYPEFPREVARTGVPEDGGHGDLIIDTDGNVWTAYGAHGCSYYPFPTCYDYITIRKFSHVDGTVLKARTIVSGGKLHFAAFGMIHDQNRMYIAYEDSEAGNLILELRETENLDLVERREFMFDFPIPGYVGDYHSLFHDGFVDDEGNFTIGGNCRSSYYPEWIFQPVIIKFDSNLNQMFSYVSSRQIRYQYSSMKARIEPCGNNHTLYYAPSPIDPLVIRINENGEEVSTKELWASIKMEDELFEYPEGTGCFYETNALMKDFVYSNERIIETGSIRLNNCQTTGCIPGYYGSGVICYGHEFERAAILVTEFSFERFLSRYTWPWFAGPFSPCPECARSFSKDWYMERMPPYLTEVYESTRRLLLGQLGHPKSARRSVKHIAAEVFEEVPVGPRFNQDTRESILASLKEFEDSGSGFPSVLSKLVGAVNAIDLDWRVPMIPRKKIRSGKNVTVDFRGVAWITFKDVQSPGECSLKVEGGVPALVEGFQLGWPIASYHFDFKGKMTNELAINFYIAGMKFPDQTFSPRILQWDGKSYEDITTNIDFRRKVVTGRTNKLGTYVIMDLTPGAKTKEEKD